MNLIQLSSSSAGIAMFLIIGVSMLSGQGFKREVADMFAEASSDELRVWWGSPASRPCG
jgi:hypothetical protein